MPHFPKALSLSSQPRRAHDPFSILEYVLVLRGHVPEDQKVPSDVPKGLGASRGLLTTGMSGRMRWDASNR